MQLFHPEARNRSPEHQRIYALYAVWYTVVDFLAAFQFIIGSVLFFWQSTEDAGIWLFICGSICFALKPTLRLAREIKFLSMGDYRDLAQHELE